MIERKTWYNDPMGSQEISCLIFAVPNMLQSSSCLMSFGLHVWLDIDRDMSLSCAFAKSPSLIKYYTDKILYLGMNFV